MNQANILRGAVEAVRARLPTGWKASVRTLSGARDTGADAVLDITAPDGSKARLLVEAKSALVPRAAIEIAAKLARVSPDPGLVVAPFLSAATQDRLRAAGVNYLDLTGNMRIVLSRPALFLETQGASVDPSPSREPGRSLKGAKAGRIVRALCDFPEPLPISDLAGKAQVDISYASRMVTWLAREALLDRRPRGAVERVDKPALIRRWAGDYGVLTSNDAVSYLEPRGLDNLVKAITGGAFRGKYAATGSLAGSRLAPVAPPRLAMLYVENQVAAAKALNLRPVDSGANVMLLTPFDDVVFERTSTIDGLRTVAASQAAVDLLTSPGRAPSEADAIIETLAKTRDGR